MFRKLRGFKGVLRDSIRFKGLKRMDFKGSQDFLRDFKCYPGFSRNFMMCIFRDFQVF